MKECSICKRKRPKVYKGVCRSCYNSQRHFENDTLRHYFERLDQRILETIKKGGKIVPPYDG